MNSFTVDTNIVLSDSSFYNKFTNSKFYLPMIVLEELDTFKQNMDKLGYNSRTFLKFLDNLSINGNLLEGVSVESNVFYTIDSKLNPELEKSNDNKIISAALVLQNTILSNDANVRIKARALNLKAEGFDQDNKKDDLYLGHRDFSLSNDQMEELIDMNSLTIEDTDLLDNEYLMINSNNKGTRLGKFIKKYNSIVLLETKEEIMGISPKNKEQKFLIDAILDPKIDLVSVSGMAGTGKTLIALASALYLVMEDPDASFKQLLIARPTVAFGEEIGFLPGDISEKLQPWMAPIKDAAGVLFEKSSSLEELINQEVIHMESLSHIRGRSISDAILWIDEVQNLSALDLKTIITRAGHNCKVILTGDISQIDSKRLDQYNNGLTYIINNLKGSSPICAHVTLVKGERSPLADLAVKLL